MPTSSAERDLESLVSISKQIVETSGTAHRNHKSLSGTGFYANKFHDLLVDLTRITNRLVPVLRNLADLDSTALAGSIEILRSPTSSHHARDKAQKAIRLLCQAEIPPRLSALSSPAVPAGEMVLSSEVLAVAPHYLRRILLQANGCYEQRWFDACSVMIRKLVESLIIEVYEKHGKEAEIKAGGEYMMLSGLIAQMLGSKHWSLQRETKRELPALKLLGDRAAHSRRYQAVKADIDQIRPGLRAAVDDLLHLAGIK